MKMMKSRKLLFFIIEKRIFMRELIREYFKDMLDQGFDLEAATDNLMELVTEISGEFKDADGAEEGDESEDE